jgi:hypothetical protein
VRWPYGWIFALFACGEAASPTGSPVGLTDRQDDGGVTTGAVDAGVDATTDAPAKGPVITTSVLSTTHRAIPGVMFGGWGPHLGHLLARPNGEVWFADDACDGAAPCDVNVNRRLDYFALPAGYASLYAIYPAAPPYQRELPSAVDVALVATVRETEVLAVHVEP